MIPNKGMLPKKSQNSNQKRWKKIHEKLTDLSYLDYDILKFKFRPDHTW